MAVKTYTHKDGVLRFYDGSATPFFVPITFLNADFTAPISRARPPENLVLNRMTLDELTHYVQGADVEILTPLELSMSFKLGNTDPVYQKFRDILNLDMGATWTVGGKTWVSTKGKSQLLSGGKTPALVTTPAFSDPRKRCVDVQVLFTDPDAAASLGHRWREVFFPPERQTLREGEENVQISLVGLVYGDISEITAFSVGTES